MLKFKKLCIVVPTRVVQTRSEPNNPAKPPDDNPIPARTEGPVGRRRDSQHVFHFKRSFGLSLFLLKLKIKTKNTIAK